MPPKQCCVSVVLQDADVPVEETEVVKHYIMFNASQRLLQLFPEIMVVTQEDLDDMPRFLDMLNTPPYQMRLVKAPGHRNANAVVRQLSIRTSGRNSWNQTAMVPVLADPKHWDRLSKQARQLPRHSTAVQAFNVPETAKKQKCEVVTDPLSMVGRRISVFWEGDEEYYNGKVVSYSSSRGHQVQYDDGELQYYYLHCEELLYRWLE